MRLSRLLTPRTVVKAHCDLPCGVYDPAQARIEAESVKAICEKYQANTDPAYRTRALIIKEQRAELVKHHLRSEEHTSELPSRENLVCRLLLGKKKWAR